MHFNLTTRGWIFVIFGTGLAVVGAMLGEGDLVPVGTFIAILPLLGILVVLLLRPHLKVRRRIEPSDVALGSSTRATIDVRNTAPWALSLLMFRDKIPPQLGTDARFSLTQGFGTWTQTAGYNLQGTQRGHYTLESLRARAYDPFGTAVADWGVKGKPTAFRVTPKLWPLEVSQGASSGSASDSTPQRIGMAGADDVLVRDHRPGDDIRRIHWRLSAKANELMVRLEEHPWDPSMTVLVDNRGSANLGEGRDSSLEWCVSAAASVATELVSNRYRVAVSSADGAEFESTRTHSVANRTGVIHAMTDVGTSKRTDLSMGLVEEQLNATLMLFAALGCLNSQDAMRLSAMGAKMRRKIAFVPDTAAWNVTEERHDAHQDACRLLRAGGWQVETYRPKDSVTEVWQRTAKPKVAS